jgi:AcrR family transcriptional regulator
MLAALNEMNDRSIKFTMDDLARRLGMSKRTLYENFASKEEIVGFLLTEAIAEIKEKREAIINDDQLTICEKFKQVMTVRPYWCTETTDRISIDIKRCMPEQWQKVEKAMDELWEITERLVQEGVRQGYFRPVFFPAVRTMFKGAFNEFANHTFLLQHKVTIREMVDYMTDILMFGLVEKKADEQSDQIMPGLNQEDTNDMRRK